MSYAQKRRKEIIDKIVNTLDRVKKEGLDIDRNGLMSQICMEFGCTKRKANEYLDIAYDSISIGHQTIL